MLNRNVIILTLSQAIAMSGITMLLLIGGLIGAKLTPDPNWATLPNAVAVVGAAISSIPAAMLMKKIGRRSGFVLGVSLASVAAFVAAYAIAIKNFYLFTGSMIFFGATLAFIQQFRFAAVESVEEKQASKAVSFVLLGGIASGFLGPAIGTRAKDLLVFGEYTGSFVVMGCMYALVAGILGLFKNQTLKTNTNQAVEEARPLKDIVFQTKFITAVLAGSVAYGGMILIMIATPISMHVMDHFSLEDTARVLQSHVVAMFVPSLFTGYLIQRFGVLKIMISGVFLMVICSVISLVDNQFIHYWSGLVLLGVGWNFLFIGGTVYLTTCYRPSEAFKSQAFNDFTVFGIQATASLLAGALIFSTSWSFIHYSALVIFFLMLLRLGLEMSRSYSQNAVQNA